MAGDPILDFELPSDLEASVPPEERGAGRDDVRLLVSHRSSGLIEHWRFPDLPELLLPGDLLVVNSSATIPAALSGTARGEPVRVHLSTQEASGRWTVELRHPDQRGGGSTPWLDAQPGTLVALPAGGRALLVQPAVSAGPREDGVRLWQALLELSEPVSDYLARHGRPIRYGHVDVERPLSAYQSVFAREPGSAEMPSAARPFTAELVSRLGARSIGAVPVVLHCGVSSLEGHEPPQAESFRVPPDTAARVNATRRRGGRIVAVGTTVVRALESAVDGRGTVHPVSGWAELVIDSGTPLQAVDGMITGWHEPRASHLALVEAVAGRRLLEASYRSALAESYLWHEFGDSHLIVP